MLLCIPLTLLPQHHRRSKPDNECATTCESPAAPPVLAPQCPESTSTSVTTTLDPTARTYSVSAITTLQASISPSDCVSRGRSLIHHRPLALPPHVCASQRTSCWRLHQWLPACSRTASESLDTNTVRPLLVATCRFATRNLEMISLLEILF